MKHTITIELLPNDVMYLTNLLEDKIRYGGEIAEIRRALSLYNQLGLIFQKELDKYGVNE